MSATPLALNNVLMSAYWRASGGSWNRIAMHAISPPAKSPMPERVEQVLNGDVQGCLVTKRPLPTGTMTISDIPTTASSVSLQDAVRGINNGASLTPVNASITRTVGGETRLFDLKIDYNAREAGGQSYYEIMTGVEFQFPANPANDDSGNRYEVPLVVWGDITRTNL